MWFISNFLPNSYLILSYFNYSNSLALCLFDWHIHKILVLYGWPVFIHESWNMILYIVKYFYLIYFVYFVFFSCKSNKSHYSCKFIILFFLLLTFPIYFEILFLIMYWFFVWCNTQNSIVNGFLYILFLWIPSFSWNLCILSYIIYFH